jgi:hypothetical protein
MSKIRFFGTHYDFIFDPSWKARVCPTPLVEAEKDKYIKEGIPRARKNELNKAMDLVVAAREVFQNAHPTYPKKHRHFVVVSLSELIEKVKEKSKTCLDLKDRECAAVIDRLESHARLAPPPPRRSTRFPKIKNLKKKITKKMSSKDLYDDSTKEDSAELERSEALKQMEAFEMDSLEKEPFKKEPPSGMLHMASKLNLPHFWHKKPEETEVSFSMFLQALHAVYGEKCLDSSGRRSSVIVALDTKQSDFSEYLQ